MENCNDLLLWDEKTTAEYSKITGESMAFANTRTCTIWKKLETLVSKLVLIPSWSNSDSSMSYSLQATQLQLQRENWSPADRQGAREEKSYLYSEETTSRMFVCYSSLLLEVHTGGILNSICIISYCRKSKVKSLKHLTDPNQLTTVAWGPRLLMILKFTKIITQT